MLLSYAFESLREDLAGMEITQQVRKERSGSSESDRVIDMVEDAVEEPVKEDEETESSPDGVPEQENGEGETEPDEAGEGDGGGGETDEEPELGDDATTTAATESIRLQTRIIAAESAVLSNEGIKDALISLAGIVRELGVTYGPKILAALKFMSIKAIEGAAKLTIIIRDRSKKAYFKYKTSMTRHRSELAKLKEALEKLSDVGASPSEEEKYRVEKIVRWGVVGKVADFSQSAAVMKTFATELLGFMDQAALADLDTLISLMALRKNNSAVNLANFFDPRTFDRILSKTSHGEASANKDTIRLKYPKLLPRNVELVAFLPDAGKIGKDFDDGGSNVIKALRDSGIVLSPAKLYYDSEPSHRYLSVEELTALVDQLLSIANTGLARAELFRQIEKRIPKIKSSYQGLLERFLDRKNNQEATDSFRYVEAKQTFFTNVYLTAAFDTHDYVSSYLTAVRQFVKANLTHLANQHKSAKTQDAAD